ncbi:hypothetical protein BU16DRAFT_523012 [Lophium mytilinum]|uniref:ABM domain-containing protein n=1 Tax=Lophium mytilinum TaxID=390894 RepID=A0A6A6R8L4_9PEZI|nr:hypothetical protein BU16DRAFT_523012 [Lophium mytilinum]
MTQAAEKVTLPLKAGIDLGSGEYKTALESALKALSEAEGAQKVFWGTQVEHPEVLELSVDWRQASDFQTFINSAAYPGFRTTLGTIVGGPPKINILSRFQGEAFSTAVSVPIAEVVTLTYPASISEDDANASFAKFKSFGDKADGALALVGGWSVEEVPPAEGDAKVFVGVIGWESLDAHMAFRTTEVFKEAVEALRAGSEGIEMHHVKFTQF